jgi:hypothetical protein
VVAVTIYRLAAAATTAASALRRDADKGGLSPEIRNPDPDRIGDPDAYTAVSATVADYVASRRAVSATADLFVDHLRAAARTYQHAEDDLHAQMSRPPETRPNGLDTTGSS